MSRKNFSEEKRKMFRLKERMEEFRDKLEAEGCIIIRSGYISQSTYRNYGFKYGIVFREKLKQKGTKK